jgi:zinc transport system substrate-binding protein
MYRIHSILPFLFVLLTGIAVQATAAPSVLVTVPALHSLVSGLMDGIAERKLLMDDPEPSPGLTLSGSQLRMLANIDMIVWAGPGLGWAGKESA